MISYRCPRCWKSFDTRGKVSLHERQGGCNTKQRPDDERFMDPIHEVQVERAYSSTSEEDVWWSLFRLLIPDVQYLDDLSLKTQFYPYYIHIDMPLMIPALTFSDTSFQPLHLGASSHSVSLEASDSGRPAIHVPKSDSSAAAITHNSLTPGSPGRLMPMQGSGGSQLVPQGSTAAAESDPQPQLQLQRNSERLRQRLAQAEAENEELREVSRLSRADLGRVNLLLDELLDMTLPSGTYEKLSEVADMLAKMRKRLR
ncbi:hypothetical protein MFIFM68171_06741 [Madurella fahalii]|uniref:C2H2-type domain-containing protein n=1 Tax=Madurella fahalii TaxID=1157608 RepID=A0ABQ0GFI4_9PEZI